MRKFAFVALMAPLAACGGGGGGLAENPATSGIKSVSGGTVDINLSQERNESIFDADVGTVAYVVGINSDRGQIGAYAGIAPGADVGSAETGGTASYDASYGYLVADNIVRIDPTPSSAGSIQGRVIEETGSITLVADFDSGSLTGTGPELAVNGSISGGEVGGTVTANYSGIFGPTGSITGDLSGDIGSTGVIAVFEGNDANTAMAGGLVGPQN